MKTPAALFACAAIATSIANAGDGLRVATWNITNYNGGNATHVQNVVYGEFNGNSLSPDVILLQEFSNVGAQNAFLNALNSAPGSPGDWAGGQFFAGGGGGINTAVVYRTSKLDLLASILVAPAGGTSSHPRNIVRYDLRLDGYTAEETVMALYPVHMKAGSGSSAFKNCNGTIFWPWNSTSSIRVMPTLPNTSRCLR